LFTLAIVFIAFLYIRGWLRLRSIFLNVIPAWRAGGFLFGLFMIWVAVASPLAEFDREMLTVHMFHHLLLLTLAPPLIWLGPPLFQLLRGPPHGWVQLRRKLGFPWRRRGSALTRPAFCWLAATAALVVWHVPAAFTLGLQSGAWHMVEHASFLVTGLLF